MFDSAFPKTVALLLSLSLTALVSSPAAEAQNRNLNAERLLLDDDAVDGTRHTLTLQVPVAGLSADRIITFPDASGSPLMTAAPLTAGQVLFGGAGNTIAQSANLFWDNGTNELTLTQPTANAALLIDHSGTDGFGIFIDQTDGSNSEDVLRVDVAGDGDALNINVEGGGNGLDIDMDVATTNDALSITHDGAGDGLDVNMGAANTDEGVSIEHDGTGIGLISRGFGGGQAAVFVEEAGERAVTIDEINGGEGLVVFESGGGDGLGVLEEDGGWGMGILESGNGDGLHIIEEDDGAGLHIESFDDGRALFVQQNSTTAAAARIELLDASATGDGLAIGNPGTGRGLDLNQSGTGGQAARIRITNATNTDNVLLASTAGTGRVLDIEHAGTSGQAVRIRATDGGNTDDVVRIVGNTGSNGMRVTAGDVDIDENLNVDGTADLGTVRINGAATTTNSRLMVDDGHWTSQQTTAPGAGVAGANVTSAVLSNATDVAGLIDVTTSGAPAAGAQATVTFDAAYATAPIVTLTPANASGAGVGAYVTRTTTGFTVSFLGVPAGTTSYQFFYQVIETQ